MSIRVIPAPQWPEFLDRFSRQHRAWLATVDRGGAESAGQGEAVARPLGAVVPRVNAGGVADIEIRFQDDRAGSQPVRIVAPTIVRVEESGIGVAHGLEIENERHECTRISFRAAPPAELLDGLAPGELPPADR